jgi:hypothetical protein
VRRFKSGIQFLYMRALEVNGGIPASLVLPRHLPAQMLALRISLSLSLSHFPKFHLDKSARQWEYMTDGQKRPKV